MSKNKNKHKKTVQEKLDRDRSIPEAKDGERKVLMRFKEHKYYNDLGKPIYEAGKIYEITGAAWIQRWQKRGGEIVEDPKAKPEAVAHIPASEVANPVPVGLAVEEKAPEAVVESPADQSMGEELNETQEEEKEVGAQE